ncbi:trypsin-like peptidase domain-containing protein [Streptomyces sp. NPDC000594]|uniref:S1C family serine protease n=1 Tax=Streptomyces sp. NPDC000594 TaxID=3154261 RepID=UPI003326A9C4
MDDGKTTEARAAWWSRPGTGPLPGGGEPSAPAAVPSSAPDSAPSPPSPSSSCPPPPVPSPGVEPAVSGGEEGPEPAPETADAGGGSGAEVRGPTVSLTKAGAAAGAPVPAPAVSTEPPAPGEAVPEPVAGPVTPLEPVPVPVAASLPLPEPVPVPVALPAGDRTQPLHQPDAYSTPPYGEPGPWAPAPPVQRPVPPSAPAPALPLPPGAAVPPQYPGPQPYPQESPYPQENPYAHPAGPGPVPGQPQDGPPQAPAGQWANYDPWGAPGAQVLAAPLSRSGEPPRRRAGYGPMIAGGVLLALIAGGIGGGIGAYVERNGGINRVELDQAPRQSRDRAPDSVAGIAAKALPGVVTLHVSGGGEQGTGTGFVLDGQGHILTNNHVVAPAGESGSIRVTFSGGETVRATLVGKDSGYDLAVVKVTGVSGLTPLPLGNSDNVQVGDPVVAIGAPFDLQNTVTSGIISAKDRPITAGGDKGDGSDVSYVDALQTDAPINPGNSGGPLVDTTARVIGINSAIRAADTAPGAEGQSGSIGLGFAIPINQGKRVAEELINTGKATHPVIGVTLDLQYSGDGARVGRKAKDDAPAVVPGGPSAKAGIRPGDVITAVDGRRVHSGEELIVKIRAHRPGDRLRLTLVRGGKQRTVTVTLGSSADR